MTRGTFEVLALVKTAVDNKPVDSYVQVYLLSGELVYKTFTVMDQHNVAVENVEAELFLHVPNLQLNLDNTIRCLNDNSRWRIIKIFPRAKDTLLWVARSSN